MSSRPSSFGSQIPSDIADSASDQQSSTASLNKRSHETPFNLISLIESLRQCDSPADVLEQLLPLAKRAGLEGIRYYRLRQSRPEDDVDEIYGVDSVGCGSHLAELMRSGTVRKKRSERGQAESESFWAIDAAYPIAFVISNNKTPPLQLSPPGNGLPVLEVPLDDKDPVEIKTIKMNGSRKWVDIPLLAGTWTIGKLSCDFTDSKSRIESPSVHMSVMEFARAVEIAAPVLEILRNTTFPTRLRLLIGRLESLQSTEDLMKACVRELQSIFNCEQADFFLSSIDSFGRQAIILKQTSFRPSFKDVNQSLYDVEGRHSYSLTATATRYPRPIKVDRMVDPVHRETQLESYRRKLSGTTGASGEVVELNWSHGISLSHRHGSLMISRVAINNKLSRNEYGLVRMADKRQTSSMNRSSGKVIPFEERDEALLEAIVTQAIGPKLATLRHQETLSRLTESMTKVRQIPSDDPNPFNSLISIVAEAFPEQEGARKKYTINKRDGATHFNIVAEAGSLERSDQHAAPPYPMLRTMTNEVIESGEVRFYWDLPYAASKRVYRPFVKGAKCALGCPIRYRGNCIGAILILSSAYDLSLERDAAVLKSLADEAGVLLEHHNVAVRLAHLAGVSHDIDGMVHAMQRLVGQGSAKGSAIIETLSDLFAAYRKSRPMSPKSMATASFPQDVLDIIRRIIVAARSVEIDKGDACEITVGNEVPCRAEIYQPILAACLFNVLRNAIRHAKTGESIFAQAWLTETELFVRVTNKFAGAISERTMRREDWIRDDQIGGIGLAIIEHLMSDYRFPGTSSGSVTCEPDASLESPEYVCTLRFPLPASY